MPDNNKPLSPQGYLIGMLPMPDNPFWGDLPEGGHGLPPGGTTGQVLTKKSSADYDADWEDAQGGGGTGTNYQFSVDATNTGDPGTDAAVSVRQEGAEVGFTFTVPRGAQGTQGPAGPGVAAGGTVGQILRKKSATDYDTEWADPQGGGGVVIEGKNFLSPVKITKEGSEYYLSLDGYDILEEFGGALYCTLRFATSTPANGRVTVTLPGGEYKPFGVVQYNMAGVARIPVNDDLIFVQLNSSTGRFTLDVESLSGAAIEVDTSYTTNGLYITRWRDNNAS